MSAHSSPIKKLPNVSDYESVDENILRQKNAKIFNHKIRPNSVITISPIKKQGKQRFDWNIFGVKILCFIFVVLSWFVVFLPYSSLIRFFLGPDVNVAGSLNAQTERIDSICGIVNNSTLGFQDNRSSNLNLTCEFPYTNNGSLCVPICGTWHPGGHVYHIVTRVVSCVASTISLIFSILGIITWLIIGKKLFAFPQVIPFYLFVCAGIQAICILIGQIHYVKFYCSHEDLISSRIEPTIQCYIQGAVYHYVSFIFVFWYLFYVAAVLLILMFPFTFRVTEGANWKPHLVLFIVAVGLPLLILGIFWAIDSKRYEIVNHPLVCLPTPTGIVAMFIVPLTLILGLSLTSVILIINQLVINQLRLRNHKTSNMNNKQNQFIFRTLAVIVCFTVICLYLIVEFGVRVSFSKPFISYVELYWACITRYGTNTSCCEDNYTQFYHPELTVLNDFFFSIWGVVALSTLAVKEARIFWLSVFKKCLCRREHKIPEPEPSSTSHYVQKRRLTEVVFLSSGEGKKLFDAGNETGAINGTGTNGEIGTKDL
ncbi:hypothetical protein LOD99_11556 [Oopsacas minuta]|uniref:G-protein coupled receptors family 2 profile 2 domain-containing protein n=1 Tax=Oopsacas minuta TaxID=111878 RepID=A0AAV7JJR5_9METZ|nr:hypothetical protein LOD99_11556 [Oopsacas minuta]